MLKNFFTLLLILTALCTSFAFADKNSDNFVTTEEEARNCLIRAKALMASLGLPVNRDIYTRIEEMDSVQTHFSNSGVSGERTIAFYQAHSPEYIMISKGYPFQKTTLYCVHELTHAWQSTNCPLQEEAISEAFAYWVQGQAATLLGRSDLGFSTIMCSGDSLEMEVYQYLNKLYKTGGMKSVIDYVTTTVKYERK